MSENGATIERVTGVVAVIERDGAWLMIQRAEGVVLGGAWCFPGGAVQQGESRTEALVRELSEELDLTIQAGNRLWRWVRADGRLEIEWWSAQIIRGEPVPNPTEVSRAAWLTPQAIRDTPGVLPNNIEFVDYATEYGLLPPS